MLFSNTYNKNNSTMKKINMDNVMGFSKRYAQFNAQRIQQLKTDAPIVPIVPPKPVMIWGAPIWTLFHTLAEKTTDETFAIVGKDIVDIISKICNNLPCPSCTEHATDYMLKNKFNNINSRDALREFLFKFHNDVNKRKNVPLLEIGELSDMYAEKEIVLVIRNFMNAFKDKHFSIRMIANDFHRNRVINYLSVWFNSNIQHFI